MTTHVVGASRNALLGYERRARSLMGERATRLRCGRVQRRMEGCMPPVAALVSDHGHDESIPGASRGDIEKAHGLLALALALLLCMLEELRRTAAGKSLNTKSACGVCPAAPGFLNRRCSVGGGDGRGNQNRWPLG